MLPQQSVLERIFEDSPMEPASPLNSATRVTSKSTPKAGPSSSEAIAATTAQSSSLEAIAATSAGPSEPPTVQGTEEVALEDSVSAEAQLELMIQAKKEAEKRMPGLDCGGPTNDIQAMAASVAQMANLFAQIMPTMQMMKSFIEGTPMGTSTPSQTQGQIKGPEPSMGRPADPIPPELLKSLEFTVAKFRNEMFSLNKMCTKLQSLEANQAFFHEHRDGPGLSNPAALPTGMRPCPTNSSG